MADRDRPLDRWQLMEDLDGPTDDRPVGGAMAAYVGRRYREDELWASYWESAEVYPEEEATLRPRAARMRAFDVPALTGATLTVDRLSTVAGRLEGLLRDCLPGIVWVVDEEVTGPLAKYGILHGTAPAPTDESTGQAMVLELVGQGYDADGRPLGRRWFDPFQAAWRAAQRATPLAPSADLQAQIKAYYDTKGVWAGTYVLKQFFALTIRPPANAVTEVCVAYVCAAPQTPTTAEGVDIRTFQLQQSAGGGWDVVAMGDHQSCTDVAQGPTVTDASAQPAIKAFYATVRYPNTYVIYRILSATYDQPAGFLNYLVTAHMQYTCSISMPRRPPRPWWRERTRRTSSWSGVTTTGWGWTASNNAVGVA